MEAPVGTISLENGIIQWDVKHIPPGKTMTMTLIFRSENNKALSVYSEVLTVDSDDLDSTPGNGVPYHPAEDDETLIRWDGPGSPSTIEVSKELAAELKADHRNWISRIHNAGKRKTEE